MMSTMNQYKKSHTAACNDSSETRMDLHRSMMNWKRFAPVVVSLFLHIVVLFSIFMSSNRVDAYMIDTIMATERFNARLIGIDDKAVVSEDVDDDPVEETCENDNCEDLDHDNGHSQLSIAQRIKNIKHQYLFIDWLLFNDLVWDGMLKDELTVYHPGDGRFYASERVIWKYIYHYNLGDWAFFTYGPDYYSDSSLLYLYRLTSRNSWYISDVSQYSKNTSQVERKSFDRKSLKISISDASGALGISILKRVVNKRRNELVSCFEGKLKRNRELHGSVDLVGMISSQGAVTKTLIKTSSLHNRDIERCLSNNVRYWRFPNSNKGVTSFEIAIVYEP